MSITVLISKRETHKAQHGNQKTIRDRTHKPWGLNTAGRGAGTNEGQTHNEWVIDTIITYR